MYFFVEYSISSKSLVKVGIHLPTVISVFRVGRGGVRDVCGYIEGLYMHVFFLFPHSRMALSHILKYKYKFYENYPNLTRVCYFLHCVEWIHRHFF